MNRTWSWFLARAAAWLLVATSPLVGAPAGAQMPPTVPPVIPAGPQGAVPAGPQGAAGAYGQAPAPGAAPPSPWIASILVRETVTDNVNLAPSGSTENALVTEITPSLSVNYRGSRTSLVGSLSLPVVLYVPRGSASDRVYPGVDLVGDIALVKNFLFVEGAVNVTQQFFSPFGAQPTSLTNPTQNRYRSDLYRLSPYIRSVTQAGTNYELRNDNVWTNLSGAPVSTNNSYYTSWTGTASNVRTTLGWKANFDYTDVKFNNQSPITTQHYRASPIYNVDPSWQLFATGGYEKNQFTASSSSGATYGAGFVWHPTPRTNVAGDYEHRFFGASYRFSFEHTTPLSVWNVQFLRNTTSYPQQLATLPAGVNVAGFLNNLFLPSIPDPVARQQLVDQLIQDRGLPTTLSSAVNLYAQQILLQQSVSASVGLIGARNTVLVTLYTVKNQSISGSGAPLPPIFIFGNDSTQNGGTIVWTHHLTPTLSLITSADGVQTVGNTSSSANTKQATLRVSLSSPIAPRTTLFAGARYQTLQSNVAPDYAETAVFVGLRYTFR